MNRLTDIGFTKVGTWQASGDQISFDLTHHAADRNILYAFVCNGVVKYVGKTIRPLRVRMSGYKHPGESQSTNIKINGLIKSLLAAGEAVDILALPDSGLMHFGQFHLNLAAGLEDNIIAVLKPEWNGRGPRPVADEDDQAPVIDEPPPIIDSFALVVHPTYFKSGFFNVPIDHADQLADDAQPIDIFCGDSQTPIHGYINRTANKNQSPRIMGGTALRDWFQNNVAVMQEANVNVLTPNAIRIYT